MDHDEPAQIRVENPVSLACLQKQLDNVCYNYDPSTELLKKVSVGDSPDWSMQDFVQADNAKIQVLMKERSVQILQAFPGQPA
jgi:hypothetical protein